MAKKIQWGTYTPRRTTRFPKLHLDKGEKSRISFLEEAPVITFIHSFSKVQIGPDGSPIEEDVTYDNGNTVTRLKTEYAGKFRCLGDQDKLDASGIDPENCPACKAHVTDPNAVKAPVPRMLGHVLKYATKPDSFAVKRPFSAELVVWDLTERRFETLSNIYEEYEEERGGLHNMDLILGPCENAQMQTFDIQAGGGAAEWTKTEETRQFVEELLEENRVEDLAAVAGRLPTEFEMRTLTDEIVRTYKHAVGEVIPGSAASYLEDEDSDEEEETPPKKSLSTRRPTKSAPVAQEEEEDDSEEETPAPPRKTRKRKPEPEPEDEEEDDYEDEEDEDDSPSLDDLLRNIQ